MRYTSTWAVLALLGLTGSCAPQPRAPGVSVQPLSPALGFANALAYRVKDLNPGAGDGLPERLKPHFSLHALGSTLFLRADDGIAGPALWRSDGTESGTRLVKDFTPDASENLGDEPAVLNGALYFLASGADGLGLWKVDETSAAPTMVHSLAPQGQGPTHSLRPFGTRLSFVHTAADTGTELWVTDGTAVGTHIVADVRPGAASSEPQYVRHLNGTLFFTADDGVHGRELWRSDGGADTRIVKELRVDGDAFRPFDGLLRMTNEALYFAANAGVDGCGLWRTDGSELGTVLVKSFADGCATSEVWEISSAGDRIFFTVRSSDTQQLWRTDGTAETTVLLLDDVPGDVFGGLLPMGDRVFFVGRGSAGGEALWSSDGTQTGTMRVKDVAVHADNFYGYTVLDGLLVFRGDDGVHGKELWRSDGTPEGTFMVADVRPGPESSDASHFALAGDTLYFRATDGVSGYELWAISMAKVHDPIAPTLTCPADVDVTASSPAGASVTYPPAAVSDNSSAPVSPSYSHPSGSNFPVGRTQVVVMAQDAAQNQAGCSFQVTVREAGTALPGEELPEGVSACGSTSGSRGGTWLAALGLLAFLRVRRSRREHPA